MAYIKVICTIVVFSALTCGCIPLTPNHTIIEYRNLGITAEEHNHFGKRKIFWMDFDLRNNAITSIVCAVEGKEYVACDKTNPQRESPIYSYENNIGTNGEIVTGTGGGRGYFVSSRYFEDKKSRIVTVDNCTSNVVIQVRMNEKEWAIPCTESDLITVLGPYSDKRKIKGPM